MPKKPSSKPKPKGAQDVPRNPRLSELVRLRDSLLKKPGLTKHEKRQLRVYLDRIRREKRRT